MQTTHPEYSTGADLRLAAADAWRAILAPPPDQVRQRREDGGFSHTERHLHCIWFDALLRPDDLRTSEGETVTVIDPGRWNLEPGPDFRGAVLQLGPDARRVQGDVEVHIHPADWEHHGHADDPRYRRVVAHVTYSAPRTPPKGLPPATIGIALREALAAIPSFSMEAIDITAYPYASAAGNCPCADIMRGWPPDKTAALLETAGTYRLEQKAARLLAARRQTPVEVLAYRETMAALGYKQNSASFRALADRVPETVLRGLPPLEAYALLLGVSGLLPATPSPHWTPDTRDVVRRLWDVWWPQQTRWHTLAMPSRTWNLAALRPQNHPIRRLAAAAVLFADETPLPARLEQYFRQGSLHLDTLAALTTPPPPLDYWLHHLSFGSARRQRPVALLGKARLSAWLVNIVLPLLASGGSDIAALLPTLAPEQTNSVMRDTAHRLLGRDHNPSLYAKSGLRQQGLMQIFHDFCLTGHVGGAGCPLPATLTRHGRSDPHIAYPAEDA